MMDLIKNFEIGVIGFCFQNLHMQIIIHLDLYIRFVLTYSMHAI